ncbi:phytoene desaturase family protein [Natrialbaceae archaeon GCM10025896]
MCSNHLAGESIGIVGAGFGGLTAAAYLAAEGADVTVYEKQPQVGGVAGVIEEEGVPLRYRAVVVSHARPLRAVFRKLRLRTDRLLQTRTARSAVPHPVDRRRRRGEIPADTSEVIDIFESYETGAGAALESYLEQSAETYEIGMNRFVIPNRSRFRDYLSLDVLRSARGLSLLGTMDDHVAEYVDHPKLQQILQYTLVFLGGAPHNTPALYNLMSHVDFELGVYYPQGGMYAVVEAIAAVARDAGAEIQTETEVTGLQPVPDGVTVQTATATVTHDRVVCNAPAAHVERELLGPEMHDRDEGYWTDRTYAPSAYMLYLGVEGDLPELEHHTLVLPPEWDDHFESIFETQQWPAEPSYYVNVPSKTDPTAVPSGHETVVVLVPIAPGLADTEEARERMRTRVLDSLADHADTDLCGRIAFEREICVSEYREQFNKPRGTALGMAHTLFQTGPMRPSHRAPGVDRLYYVGGDTNPGIGVPMCLLSGEHVTETIVEDASESGPIRSFIGYTA